MRGTLDADAAAVVLDMKPGHEIEFMHRSTAGAAMTYDDGTLVATPVWLRLAWKYSGSAAGNRTSTR